MTAADPVSTAPPRDRIAAVRRFNRFHTKLVGALGETLLASEYSLPQVRILYEIAHAPLDAPVAAIQLARDLGIDAGYLSRLITSLEAAGHVARAPSPGNAKRLILSLTPTGREVFRRLDAASAREVATLLRALSESQQAELVAAMTQVMHLLSGDATGNGFTLREPRPGDLGAVVRGHGILYAEEYGWDWTFEALVAEIVAKFARDFAPGKERCWVAQHGGQVVGSAFVVRHDDATAQLRLLYVDRAARGLGIGRRLVDACIDFARTQGYGRMVLWTNDVLVSARRIYEAAGFELQEEEAHHSFGKELVGQSWSRAL
ncbi:MAG: helix-turn-helix domain-containing GNAT family N-acetyltransferase [Casimicrobiaceae bacterium]